MNKLFSVLSNFWKIILAAGVLKWMSIHAWLIHDWYGFSWEIAVWDSAVSNFLIIGLSFTTIKAMTGNVPGGGKFWYGLALIFFLSWVWQWLTNESLSQLAYDNAAYLEFLKQAAPVRWSIGFLLIGGVTMSSYFYSLSQEKQKVMERQAATASMVREAELQKLQLQLQPHFLFNSLNSINALTMVQPEEARQMVQQLSDFLRLTMKRADEHWVELADEWAYLQQYLAIEKVRFGHRLEIASSFAPESQTWKIPTLILQPLVENAIKHGLYGTTGNIIIEVKAAVVHNTLEVTITNPFDPENQNPSGSGFGLSGVRRRLYLLFARNDLVRASVDGQLFL
ncbi:MAG: histidine kinase [Bacteroidia bacterium]|nr:histidine kinase [Bacteroidia bacterium]